MKKYLIINIFIVLLHLAVQITTLMVNITTIRYQCDLSKMLIILLYITSLIGLFFLISKKKYISALIILLITLRISDFLIHQHYKAPSKMIIAVANFDQIERKFHIGKRIQRGLINDIEKYGLRNIKVERVKKIIEGKEEANKIGRKIKAIAVVWGFADEAGIVVSFVSVQKIVSKFKKEEDSYIREPKEERKHVPQLEYEEELPKDKLPSIPFSSDEYKLCAKKTVPKLISNLTITLVGFIHFWRGEYNTIIDCINKRFVQDEEICSVDESFLYFIRGEAHMMMNDYNLAIRDFSITIENNPNFIWAYYSRGICYDNLNEYEKFIEDFSKFIELKPDSVFAYYYRALVYDTLRKYRKAILDFSQVISLDPHWAKPYLYRGDLYAMQDDYDKAIEDYTKVIEIFPTLPLIYARRGFIYQIKGNYTDAINDYTNYLNLYPKDNQVYFLRGDLYSKKNNPEYAIRDFTEAINLDPEYSDAYYARGTQYVAKHELEKANNDFTKAIELNPDHIASYIGRGGNYLLLNKKNEAIEDFFKAVDLNPEIVKTVFPTLYLLRDKLLESVFLTIKLESAKTKKEIKYIISEWIKSE